MRLLLDTHALLWHHEGSESLSAKAKSLIGAQSNTVFISSATLWEISIKLGLGKLKLAMPLRDLVAMYRKAGAELLPVTPGHAMATENLPWHHRDPFDRMLIAQALEESMTLVTQDDRIRLYDVNWAW